MIRVQNPYRISIRRLIPKKLKLINKKRILERQRKQIKQMGFDPERNRFKTVLIETIPVCNNNCPFCPVNSLTREYGIMPIGLLDKILTELKQINWQGKIALFNNNEPFCDGDLLRKIKLTKDRLPKAYHFITTNGSLLSFEKLMELDLMGLNEVRINNYNDLLKLNPPLKDLLKKLDRENVHLKTKITINMRKKNEVLSSRGGKAPNKKIAHNPFSGSICLFPFFQLNINWKGEVFICCNDAEWEIVVGILDKHCIMEIWNSKYYQMLRETLCNTGRKGIKLCSKCDFFVNKTLG